MADNFISAAVDTRRFNNAINQIAYNIQRPVKAVVRSEVGSILKQCVGETKVATQAKADVRSRTKVTRDLGYSGRSRGKGSHPITVNSGMRGDVGRVFMLKKDGSGFRRTHDKNFIPLHQHYKRIQWLDLQDAIADVKSGWANAIPVGRAAIGLARQSWVQIANSLGIDLKAVPGGRVSAAAIAKAEAAIASDGQYYTNGQGQAFSTNKSYIARLINSLPYNRKAYLDKIVLSVVRRRTQFFRRNMAMGVFQDIQKTLKAYPGFRVFMTN